MRKIYTIKEDKANVQEYYVKIILSAFEKKGFESYILDSIDDAYSLSKDSIIVSISHYTTFKLALRGFKNIFYWVQGSSPDESFMRHHSYIRKIVISLIEYFALSKARYIFMVSHGMLDYYNKKYHNDYSNKTYIMPCYNSEIKRNNFGFLNKYRKNVFCYVGGLSVWQCFSETVALYKQIEEMLPDAMFKVCTGDQDKALKIIRSYDVKNYEVKYVRPEKLQSELSSCKFGFILRDISPVNYVATPTKLSNYLASGVIPIVSDSVSFFEEILKNTRYAVVLKKGENGISKILDLSEKNIDADDIYYEFEDLFKRFYCNELHITNIVNVINKLKI